MALLAFKRYGRVFIACCVLLALMEIVYIRHSKKSMLNSDKPDLKEYQYDKSKTVPSSNLLLGPTPTSSDGNLRSHIETKVIYMYSTFFHQRIWGFMRGEQLYKHFHGCPHFKNCRVTYNETLLDTADAAIFHLRDVEMYINSRYSADNLAKARRKVPKYQKWIVLSHENPRNWIDYRPFDGLFNWTATFSREASIFIPYSDYIEYQQPKENTRNYAKEKTGLVAWAASNCGLMREKYALELEKYIDITVYGRCNKNFKKQRSCPHFNEACNKELSTYKFYLAFENDFCNDYVTEKYWERIKQEVIPVVMGANYDKGIVIPGSYIDVSDFGSIKELADYLLILDKNDTEYNKYFKYKEKYGVGGGSIYCPICAALHGQGAKESTQIDLSKSFSYQKNCGTYQAKKEKIQKQIEESKKNSKVS